MDSGNSGSMQSSSTGGGGGDEEYDSRAESSISAFLNNPSPQPSHAGPFTATATNHISNHMLDPLSNYLDPIQRISHPSSSSLVNLDMVWSKVSRSDPNQTDLGYLIPCSISSSSSSQNQQAFLQSQLAGQTRGLGLSAFPATHQSCMPPPETASRGGSLSVSASNDQPHNNNNMVRNPKKRSRASRRAPTTVLTTDTTNFRAMVQEFTGIPAPPFTSSPYRTRLDLFGSGSTIRSTSTHLEPPPPPYLLRPFAQKLHPTPHPFTPSTSSMFPPSSSSSSSSSMVDTILASNHSTTNSPSINYQLSSSSSDHLGLLKQQQQHPLNVMNNNMHNNPILSFQSTLQAQAPQKYPLGNSSSSTVLAASKTQTSLEIPDTFDSQSHLKMGVLEELGLSHAHVNVSGLHHSMVSVSSSSDGALSSRVVNNNNMRHPPSVNWAQRTNNDGDHHGGGILRSLSGTGNYSSSNIVHGEKGPECGVAARNEGMVESWINSSSD